MNSKMQRYRVIRAYRSQYQQPISFAKGAELTVGEEDSGPEGSRGRPWLQVTDFIAPCVPLGLASGRMGNFINGELWGRVADASLPWAMVFRGAALPDGSNPPRHPSQLYQFALEGVLLFVLLWLYARQPRKTGQVSGAFLFGYGVLRFVAEYFREPDAFLGLQALGLSRGQWLCVPMILAGAALWAWASRRRDAALEN